MVEADGTDDGEALFQVYVPDLLAGWPEGVEWRELDGTLVSADISGFTALSERLAARGKEGAEELSTLICDCFEGMIDASVGRGGDIVKFGGDALLVWFEGEGHAVRAASAALAMRQAIRRERCTTDGRKVHLAISIGVNSGTHHVVLVHGTVPDLMVVGPGVTATVRAESDAEANMILLSPSTAALLPGDWVGDAFASGFVLRRRLPHPPTHDLDAPRAFPGSAAQFVPVAHQEVVRAGIDNEHRQVAVSFLTFSGTDELIARGDIDLVARRVQEAAAVIRDACERHGTHVLATDVAVDGGKWVIAAGAPRAHGNNEDRLLRTIRHVVDLDPGLRLRAGVNRGALFAGDLGSTRRRVYTTLGDAMNLAARLSGRAAVGQIVVSRTAFEWSSQEFEIEPLVPFHVKGKAQPIHAGVLGVFVGRRPDLLAVDSPIVNRHAEIDRLVGAVEGSAAGTSRTLWVMGEPGVGKTRLLAEVAATTQTAEVVVMRCSALDRLHGRSAIADVLRTLLGLKYESPADEVAERLRGFAEDRLGASASLAPLLGPVLDIEVPATPQSARVPVELRADRTAQLLIEAISALVDRHTVFLVDDGQHADDTTARTLSLLATAGLELPLTSIIVTVPELVEGDDVLEVGPLGRAETTELVDALVGDSNVSTDMVRELVERCGGNPMFASELLNAVLDGALGVPDTLDVAIESRLDRLDPGDRQVLRTAALLGNEVEIEALAELVDAELLRDHDRWDRLAEFLERVGPGLVRFRFDAHRRVAYESLPYRARRALHRTVLDRLDRSTDVGGRDRLALMAHHAAATGDEALAWRHAIAGAAAAADDGMFGDAARLYRLAWAARRSAAPDVLRAVAERAGDVFEIAGDFEAAETVLARAIALSTQPVDRARLWRKRGDVAECRGDYAGARRAYGRAERALRSVSWAQVISEQAQLDCARSGLAFRQSQFGEAWQYGNRSLSQAQLIGDWATAAHAALMVDNLVNRMSWSGVQVNRPDVRGLHERAGDLLGVARWLTNQAVDRYYEGAWDEAVAMYRASAEECARFGHLASEATALNNIAEIESDRGRYDEARSLLRSARRSWRAIGYGVGIALAQSNLGRLATRTGDNGDAVPLLVDAVERFTPLGMSSMAGDAKLRLVENALLAGDPVNPAWWPSAEEIDDDVVVQIYADRLRTVEALAGGEVDRAAALAAATVERARAAHVPFDLALALRVLHAVIDDRAAEHAVVDEIAGIHAQLGIQRPPPVVPRAVLPRAAPTLIGEA
jgi:class 3 adenylate cyclase/tetratricopeptide (TPR) repeat protein